MYINIYIARNNSGSISILGGIPVGTDSDDGNTQGAKLCLHFLYTFIEFGLIMMQSPPGNPWCEMVGIMISEVIASD